MRDTTARKEGIRYPATYPPAPRPNVLAASFRHGEVWTNIEVKKGSAVESSCCEGKSHSLDTNDVVIRFESCTERCIDHHSAKEEGKQTSKNL